MINKDTGFIGFFSTKKTTNEYSFVNFKMFNFLVYNYS